MTPPPMDTKQLTLEMTPVSGSEEDEGREVLSPISKMIYGSPEGNRDSPSGIPVYVNMKNSPSPYFPETPSVDSFAGVSEYPTYDEDHDDDKMEQPKAGNGSLAVTTTQSNARVTEVVKTRNSTSTYTNNAAKANARKSITPIRRSSMSVNLSTDKKRMSISVPSVTVPLPQPSRVVKVAVRVRPFSQSEIEEEARRIVSYCGDKMVIVNPAAFDADPDAIALAAATVQCKEWAQVFRFNHVLW